ncbi:hypothetical protein JCM8547_006492 [Rhodosporidiobolus lusitaniae]
MRGMLSSQPKRSWGDSPPSSPSQENAPLRPQSSFTLTEEQWPPTPPSARPGTKNVERERERVREEALRKASAGSSRTAAGSGSSRAGSVGARRQGSVGAAAVKPLAPKPSFASGSTKLAPLFSRPAARGSSSSSSSTSSSTVRSSSFSTSTYAFNHSSTSRASSTSSSVLPKKRSLPWEELEASASASSSSSSKLSRTSSSSANFHALNGPPGGGEGRLGGMMSTLTSSSLDIKQKVVLSPEQQMVLKMVVDDEKSVFFTGSAGTGKSVLLREIISSLKRKYRGSSDAVAVTASTGMAACNIGGTTIHSFASIGLGLGTAEQLVANIKKNRNANAKWMRVKVLVIDEVSMVDGILFDKLAAIAMALKKKGTGRNANAPGRPFGGIQLVVTGDFFQLPPVTKGVTPTFAFEAKAWQECIDHTVNLTQVFRQKDTEFIDMLNEMRFGRLSEASIKKFQGLAREPKYPVGVEPTELFPMRTEVDRANQARLRALPGEEKVFKAEDGGREYDQAKANGRRSTVLDNFMAPEQLVLKVGAQVMLIKNLDTTLVNGTVGTVVGFGVPELDEEGGEMEGEEELWTVGADGEQIRVKAEQTAMNAQEARKKQKLAEKIANGTIELGPRIQWQTPHGVERKTMVREEFKVEDQRGEKTAWRKQYPIILAWAMSIHKSQGQTIARVKVDLGKVFEKGQSYVALSRATSLDGLQVLRFDAKKVAAHEKVVSWSIVPPTLTPLFSAYSNNVCASLYPNPVSSGHIGLRRNDGRIEPFGCEWSNAQSQMLRFITVNAVQVVSRSSLNWDLRSRSWRR